MARIEQILNKLKTVYDEEKQFFSASKECSFFIEKWNASSVDQLLQDFLPTPHNSEWDAERQKPAPSPKVLIQSRQSIAFMESGRKGLYKRYVENELRANVVGRARVNRKKYMLDKTLDLVTMNMYEKKTN